MAEPYLRSSYTVAKEQYDYLHGFIVDHMVLSEEDYRLYCHILVSHLTQRREDRSRRQGWIPVPAYLIKKSLPKADWKRLVRRNLMNVWDFDRLKAECNEYLPDCMMTEFFLQRSPLNDAPSPEAALKYLEAPKVNLFTGKPVKGAVGHQKHDEHRNPAPRLLKDAMEAFKACYYNPEAICKHLGGLQNEIESASSNSEKRKLESRYLTDLLAFQTVMNQESQESPWPGIMQFSPAYYPQSTGRLTHHMGGLQACSRRMKEAAYSGIPGLRNYDIKASHPHILLQLFEEAGIHSNWLTAYLDNPNAKHTFAGEVGISVDTWKQCLYAFLMGGEVSSVAHERPVNSIEEYLSREADTRIELMELLQAFSKAVSLLKADLDALIHYLRTEWITNHSNRGYAGRQYIHNAAGSSLAASKFLNSTGKLVSKGRLLAFIMQGMEASFIHHLTLLGEQYGFTPIANEHDGLITLGEIPHEAVEEARRLSGFKYSQMEEKAFVG